MGAQVARRRSPGDRTAHSLTFVDQRRALMETQTLLLKDHWFGSSGFDTSQMNF